MLSSRPEPHMADRATGSEGLLQLIHRASGLLPPAPCLLFPILNLSKNCPTAKGQKQKQGQGEWAIFGASVGHEV